MAQMKIVLTDDNGIEINTRSYNLGSSLKKLSDMEKSIENLRPQVLGDITKDLLFSAQSMAKKKVHEVINELK
jgi:hypothetical protein